jgi:hypothetical protein
MSYEKIPNKRRSPTAIHFYRIAYRDTHQVMVRLSRGVMDKAGWRPGDKVDVEFDDRKKRLRITKSGSGSFTIGTKGKATKREGVLGQVRWALREGRPDIDGTFHTESWSYRTTDNALVINTGPKMRRIA